MSRKPFATRKLRFEPLERRELLSVSSQKISGDLYIVADSPEQVDIGYDGTDWYVDTDSDNLDNDATPFSNVQNIVISLENGVNVAFHSAKVRSDKTDHRFEVDGNLTIQGSSMATDNIYFMDDAGGGMGGAQIAGDFVFTGRGGDGLVFGDNLYIYAPNTPDKTQVGRHVIIDTGNDTAQAWIEIDGLELTGTASPPGRNFDLSTGDNAHIELKNVSLADGNVSIETAKVARASSTYVAAVAIENLDTGGGKLKVSTGPGGDTITLDQVNTGGGELVVLSDAGRLKPSGQDTVTLDDVNLGAGNLTVRTGAGADVVALDDIFTTGDVFIALGAGHDTLDFESAGGSLSTSTMNNLWIRGHAGRDTITVQNVTASGRLGIRTHQGGDTVEIGGTMPGGAPTVSADSLVINTGSQRDTLRFRPLDVSGAAKFRARGGLGRDRTLGEINLFPAYRRRIRKFEDRNL